VALMEMAALLLADGSRESACANTSARILMKGQQPDTSETPAGSATHICDALNFDAEARIH
jgi:hypothetical protein